MTGVRLEGVRAEVDAAALAERRLGLRIEAGSLLVPAALVPFLVPDGPVRLTGIGHGLLLARYVGPPLPADLEVRPALRKDGWIRMELTSVRAAGLLPVPRGMVLGAVAERLAGRPGVRIGEGGHPEVCLDELLAPLGVRLPAPCGLEITRDRLAIHF